MDPNLKNEELSTEALSQVYLGRCEYDGGDCTTPGAMYTDFNLWLGELSEQQLVDWTSCL